MARCSDLPRWLRRSAALSLTASWASAASTAPAVSCPPALVVSTPGVGGGLGAPETAFATRMKQLIPGTQAVANPYGSTGLAQWPDVWPDIVAKAKAGKTASGLGTGAYHDALVDGRAKLLAKIDDVTKSCPGMTPLILVGDGQGAQIVGDLFQKGLTGKQKAGVTAVVLFGDPQVQQQRSHHRPRRPAGPQRAHGAQAEVRRQEDVARAVVLPRARPRLPGAAQARRRRSTARPATFKQHLNYTAYREPQAAADAIAKLPAFRVPDALGGTWSGTAQQSGSPDFQIEIKLSRPVATNGGTEAIQIDLGPCTGQLKYQGHVGKVARFKSTITTGPCVNGIVKLTPAAGGALQYTLGQRLEQQSCARRRRTAPLVARRPVESCAVAHDVVLIPGDGIGPELTEATRRVLEATGVEFNWDVREAGADVMDKHGGNPLPPSVLDAVREAGTALKGPITTPVGGGFRSVNVALRKELDMFGQIRPCKSYDGVRSRFENVDLVIVRENTEDLYAGIEYEQGTADAPTSSSPGSRRTAASCAGTTRASRSSRSRSPARAASSSSPSTGRGRTAAGRSRPCTRRTS